MKAKNNLDKADIKIIRTIIRRRHRTFKLGRILFGVRRWPILVAIAAHGEIRTLDLCKATNQSMSNVSHALHDLLKGGLVRKRKVGRDVFYSARVGRFFVDLK